MLFLSVGLCYCCRYSNLEQKVGNKEIRRQKDTVLLHSQPLGVAVGATLGWKRRAGNSDIRRRREDTALF